MVKKQYKSPVECDHRWKTKRKLSNGRRVEICSGRCQEMRLRLSYMNRFLDLCGAFLTTASNSHFSNIGELDHSNTGW